MKSLNDICRSVLLRQIQACIYSEYTYWDDTFITIDEPIGIKENQISSNFQFKLLTD